MSTWGARLGVFDLETTGVEVDTSRIVSACIAVLDDEGEVVSRWNWLADPGIEIPAGASAVHGITTEHARQEGRPATLVIAEIVQTLRVLFASGVPVTIYNAPYDLTLLDRECRRHGLEPLENVAPVIDPLVIDKALDRYRKGKRTLEVTAQLYEVSLDDAHDAGSDAIAAGRVAQALLRRYPDDLDISLADLHGRQEVWHAEQAASFQEYLRSKRGDDSYVADPSWPFKPAVESSSYVDTQPIPPLPPRPSGNVPVLDFSATGVLALETARGEHDEPAAPRFNSEAYRRAPRPQLADRVSEWDRPLRGDDSESVNSESLTVGELVESFPLRERDLPDTDDTQVVESVEIENGDLDLDLVEPVSAAEAVGEPETESQAPPAARPPQAVLRIAAAIITDPEGRCLLVRKTGTSSFQQAGGKLEPGESALDALTRELQEELGLELDESTAEYLGVFRADAANEPHTLVSAAVFAFETAEEVTPSGEIEELRWIDRLDDVDVELAPLTRDELLPLWASRRAGSTLF
jgi:DNA polymerase-3 subunit epsilon